jgi:hypothetical protein
MFPVGRVVNQTTFSEFRHAWLNMVIEHLNDARLRERRLYTGITGREADTDKW